MPSIDYRRRLEQDEKSFTSAAHPNKLKMQIFMTTGHTDTLVETKRSLELAKKIPAPHFHVYYPNAAHGFYGQRGAAFAVHISTFLDLDRNVSPFTC
jgi:hypothetical protein